MEKIDEISLKHYGVTFTPLQGKFAIIDRDGNPFLYRFDLSQEQVDAIYKYLEGGLFEGMFSINEKAMYNIALGYHYEALKDIAKNHVEKDRLDEEYRMNSMKLRTYAKGFNKKCSESPEEVSAGPLFE